MLATKHIRPFVGVTFLALIGSASALPLKQSLAMFETGATQPHRSAADYKRGSAGEVSRYQIMPHIWHIYSSSRDYGNPELAWWVANRILWDRTREFEAKTGRAPNAIELYLLWNKPGHFEAAGYRLSRVSRLYATRAERFANLFQSLNLTAISGGAQ
jgi:hypothetical protein